VRSETGRPSIIAVRSVSKPRANGVVECTIKRDCSPFGDENSTYSSTKSSKSQGSIDNNLRLAMAMSVSSSRSGPA
jgi:hypothetical protein